jgi:hypothetical protein
VPLIHAIARAGIALGLPIAGVWWSLSHTRPSILFAVAVNFGLMGFAFAAALIVPRRLAPALPAAYFETFPFERGGRLYERLGVRGFQRFLRGARVHGPAPIPRLMPREGGLGRLVTDTYGPEAAHGVIFLIVLIVAADALRRGWWDTALWLMLFNVAFNAYPVCSMRYVRARIRAVRPR